MGRNEKSTKLQIKAGIALEEAAVRVKGGQVCRPTAKQPHTRVEYIWKMVSLLYPPRSH